jgi:small subunit ribosomal protein S17
MAEDPDSQGAAAPESAEGQPADAPAPVPEEAAAAADDAAATPDAGAGGAEDAAEQPAPAAPAEPDAPAAARASEPAEELSPKERRRKTRSRHSGQARPPRSPEERQAERLVERRAKAARRRARRAQERAKPAKRAQRDQLPPVHARVAGIRKVRQGIVVSDKAEKTITVRIDVARRHPRYEKIVRSSNTLHAHDENNDAHEGDVVRVVESRPLSRTKRWTLVDVLERAR